MCMALWGLFIVGMIIFETVSFSSFDESAFDDGSRSPVSLFIPFFIAPLGMFVGICIMTCWGAKVGRQVEEKTRKLCDDTSATHPGISFHLREEMYITGQGSNLRSARSNYIEGMCLALTMP